jgi:hypothetical protein
MRQPSCPPCGSADPPRRGPGSRTPCPRDGRGRLWHVRNQKPSRRAVLHGLWAGSCPARSVASGASGASAGSCRATTRPATCARDTGTRSTAHRPRTRARDGGPRAPTGARGCRSFPGSTSGFCPTRHRARGRSRSPCAACMWTLPWCQPRLVPLLPLLRRIPRQRSSLARTACRCPRPHPSSSRGRSRPGGRRPRPASGSPTSGSPA